MVATWQSDICLLIHTYLIRSSLIRIAWEQYKLAQLHNSNPISE